MSFVAIGLVFAVPAGTYSVGKAGRLEYPRRKVRLKAYEIALCETTNAEFERFVVATSYVTDAERLHNAMIFEPGLKEFEWKQDKTAQWRFPNGISRGDIQDKMDHPVTSISYSDATAYCKWAGVRLPTYDEWEVACRAGTTTDYHFGNDRKKILKFANIWHGLDHLKPDLTDGFLRTSPVKSFAPNPWGLYDMYGNVFEFVSGRLPTNKKPDYAHARGGSWWCSTKTCCFFNSFDMGAVQIHASFSNQGFRVAQSVNK
jgi:formylglycine-generating enzyme